MNDNKQSLDLEENNNTDDDQKWINSSNEALGEEIEYWKNQFKDKIILVDYEIKYQQVFFDFFKEHFNDLKLKKLIGFDFLQKIKQIREYDYKNDEVQELILEEKEEKTYSRYDLVKTLIEQKSVDIVLAAPPFLSKEKQQTFKEFCDYLIKHNKKFLFANFDYAFQWINDFIVDNKIRIGFNVASGFKDRYFGKGENSTWNKLFYTNLDYEKTVETNLETKSIIWTKEDFNEHPKVFIKNKNKEFLIFFQSDNPKKKELKAITSRNITWKDIPTDYYDEVICHRGLMQCLTSNNFIYEGYCLSSDLEFVDRYKEKFSKLLPNSNKEPIPYVIVRRKKPSFVDKKVSEPIIGYNQIFYGVPGCGKSYKISEKIKKEGAKYFRTVFHPDYSNADFVGQIIPKINDDLSVSYSFNPGPFSLALQEAYNNLNEPVYLIIEEINRGNAASIFGELFQLLDRDENGCSQYGINHVNLMDFLIKNNGKKEQNINALKLLNQNNFSSENDHENYQIYIPSNLIILATMNTSDQNVFVLDTAFKRRWEFVSISNEFSEQEEHQNYFIPGTRLTWKKFLNKINNEILDTKRSFSTLEDKRLGKYFVSKKFLINPNDNNQINNNEIKNKFAQKVFEYLWNDVFKFERKKVFKESYFDDQNMKQEIKTSEDLINAFVQGYEIFDESVDIKFFKKDEINQQQ
ncbi:AAA family ATPase [Mycoplasma sp. E35C]|uniref:AAA family ATPase n=1 Tax=Mycoplasma sp. E35C TaxID=2801918 RepID=UPI001CA40EC3|nr:AAA family ATPase [Mycoplasma sp. E35C]QZX49469.1 AAA family ATPase [Mycoplasma sp. E35C]